MSQLVMYSRKDCPNCEALVEQLDNLGIVYTKIMVDNNYKAKAKLIAAGFDSIPVLAMDENVLIGGSVETMVQAAVELKEKTSS